MNTSEEPGLKMKQCVYVPPSGWVIFISKRLKNDEPLYTYTDEYKKPFMKEIIKGVKVGADMQCYESKNSNILFYVISKE